MKLSGADRGAREMARERQARSNGSRLYSRKSAKLTNKYDVYDIAGTFIKLIET